MKLSLFQSAKKTFFVFMDILTCYHIGPKKSTQIFLDTYVNGIHLFRLENNL